MLRAGVELKLDPGWHTYWRDPGDTGVPPTFDFSGSDNVKSATVQWPAPERFPDGAGGTSIGYVDHVILPVQVAPKDAAKQSLLHLKLGYAICGNLCIPAEAKLQLALNGNGAEDQAIAKAEIHVPRRVPLGPNTGPSKSLAILAVHREPGKPHDRVVVDVAAPAGAPVDLFVEGPTPDWSLPQPEPKRRRRYNAAIHLRSRRAAARCQAAGRHAHLHRGVPRGCHRGASPSRLIRAGR